MDKSSLKVNSKENFNLEHKDNPVNRMTEENISFTVWKAIGIAPNPKYSGAEKT